MNFRKDYVVWAKTSTGWTKVKILHSLDNYYTVQELNHDTAFGVSSHRLLSDEEYQKAKLKPLYLH